MIKDELKQIYYINNEIVMWQTELALMEREFVKQNRRPQFCEETTEPYTSIVRTINKKIKELQKQQNETMNYIQGIEDPILRKIIVCRYLSLLKWEQVALNIGGMNSGDGVRVMHDRFLKSYNY